MEGAYHQQTEVHTQLGEITKKEVEVRGLACMKQLNSQQMFNSSIVLISLTGGTNS